MADKKYMVQCDTHSDGFPAAVTHKQAKEAIKFAKEIGAKLKGSPIDCKFKIVPYVAPRLDFSEALRAAKHGHKIARDNWNAKEQFVYYVPAGQYPAVTDVAREIAKDTVGNLVPYTAYMAIKTVQNTVAPWLASQTDLLADDWYVVEA